MRVSVVVCAYTLEMYEHVRDAAESVLGQTHSDIELVLISDGDEALYHDMKDDYGDHENVLVGVNEENRGLSYSRNHGIKLATGDIVAFLDDDAIAEPDWIEELVGGYERHDALAVGGRMAPEWVAGKPAFLPEEFYWLIGVTHRGFPGEECEVRNTFGSNISFRRDVLEKLDGFAERLGRQGESQGQGEETELAARMRDQYGESVWYVPDAVVRHKIFDYRTDPVWLAKRAFWQGYSKYEMASLRPKSGTVEGGFLRSLVTSWIPSRVKRLVTVRSARDAAQLIALLGFTGAVSCGYLYGVAESYYREFIPMERK